MFDQTNANMKLWSGTSIKLQDVSQRSDGEFASRCGLVPDDFGLVGPHQT